MPIGSTNLEHKSLIPSFLLDKIILALIFILFFDFALFPLPIMASNAKTETDKIILAPRISDSAEFEEIKPSITYKVKKVDFYEMTAYTSEVAQTDASPCITANGFNVCKHGIEDTVAINGLKFGTKIRIPDLYGNRVFVVRDRMNRRYQDRVDIWMKDKKQAIKFGFKVAKVEILE